MTFEGRTCGRTCEYLIQASVISHNSHQRLEASQSRSCVKNQPSACWTQCSALVSARPLLSNDVSRKMFCIASFCFLSFFFLAAGIKERKRRLPFFHAKSCKNQWFCIWKCTTKKPPTSSSSQVLASVELVMCSVSVSPYSDTSAALRAIALKTVSTKHLESYGKAQF